MPFLKNVREEALIRSQRHCCVCHEFAGRAINVHHIKQEADGGSNDIENAIVLCLRCHSEAGHFNPRHPIGTSYSPKELIRHRKNWWEACANGTALFSFSVIPTIKRVFTTSELHKYKLLMIIANGNQNVISGWKLDIFIPSVIEVRTMDLVQHEDVNIDGAQYKKYQTSGTKKVFLGERYELLDLELVVLEYDIDYRVYDLSQYNELKIQWAFYTDVEPVRKGVVDWEEMQEF